MITAQTRREVFERQWHKCAHPMCNRHFDLDSNQLFLFSWHLHHAYFKSQYKKSDRDEARNIFLLCARHHTWSDAEWVHYWEWVHNWNVRLWDYLRWLADIYKRPEDRSNTTIAKVKTRKSKIKIEKKPVTIEQKRANRLAQKTIRDKSIERYKSKHNWMSPRQVNYKKQKEYIKNKKLLSI